MSLRPPSSRCKLPWKVFEQQKDQSWKLELPRYYAGLFEATCPLLAKKTISGFQVSSNGKDRIATFRGLDDSAVKMIRAFLDWYGRTVCISTNRQLKDKFSDELDFCIALDMNSPGPKEDRTEIGEWRYQAKFKQNVDARAALASKLCRAVRMLPLAKVPIPRLLSYVPSDPGKDFCLPAELAKAVRTGIPKTFWGVDDPLVVPTLTTSKKPAKDLTVAQKIAEKVAEAKRIRLSQSVKGRSVIVVDDLYQSGVSLWSFARYLKAQQAVAVFGVACVKSLRDTDNQ